MTKRSAWLTLVATILVLLPGGTLVPPLAAQQQVGVEPDSVDELVPCCDGPRARREPPAPLVVREVHLPGHAFADSETMERMAEEGRRMAPRGRGLESAAARGEIMPLAPKLRTKFNGLDINDGGGWVPPDTILAVGPEHVLQGVNVAFRLSSKANKDVEVVTGEDFFGTGETLFDPKVHYDPLSGRFFIVILDQDGGVERSRVYMAVSRSATPQTFGPGDWCSYFFNVKKKGAWGDYPGIGTSDDWFTVSTNNFRFDNGSFSSAWLWVMDKAKLVDNADGCPGNKVFGFKVAKDDSGVVAFTLQPAQHLDDSARAGGEHHVVASQPIGVSFEYGWWTVAANTGGKPKVSSRMVESSGYAFPPRATQKGGTRDLDTIGSRLMQQVVIVDGNLWLAHASGCFFGENQNDVFSCVRVARFPVGANAPDFEDLFGVPGSFLWVPGIAVAGNGDVVTAFQMSGDTLRLSTGLAGLRGGGPRFGPLTTLADEFDDVKPAFKGKCPTQIGDPVRTGDYAGVVADPSTDDVWISGEYGTKISGTCLWDTRIARVAY